MSSKHNAERVLMLRGLVGELQAARSPNSRWLGRTLGLWLQHGGDLPKLLGVRPRQGSHATAQALTKRAEVHRLLLQLSAAAGGDERAAQWLRGLDQAPDAVAADVSRLRELAAPTSVRGIQRARQATRHRV